MSLLKTKVNKLLLKYKNGNEEAFDKLYRLTYEKMIHIASIYINEAYDQDDVVSETFITVYNKIDLFDEEKDGFNWLCKIAENKAKDKLRRKKSYVKVKQQINITDEFEIAELKCDVIMLLKNLDNDEYQLIYQRFFLNKTLQEIGDYFGYSIQTTNNKINRILKKLKKFLKNDEDDT